ncbi:MAG TPA: phosphopantothenoylcysteine decarboxylase [Leptospiraceae bacterium]|nr:phosphopantothenoylcysteine decarboxylase [Leptospiraceae bacterium]HMW05958.1 phosphopantothenoylcysteine decarboxylase [Leptospiraceae bacterium]HMX32110.1 phosphopantothenoylcysteine decarboxylase [Leptospiraceae bacterium]HMY32312.1 phosphopantothenoylcysteine decarboxylase [Leptospiraceae bacterium]HMZ62486.1 phosphopantothenoylcysteine decarboxylase [Leptospiraceae bacterium]
MTLFKKAIVTAGPTREWIDPVRYISNASSGKMGYNIAQEILSWIPNTVYVHGNVSEKYAKVTGAKNLYAETTIQMRDTLLQELTEDTLVIMAAAPADFRPKSIAENKIKKESEGNLKIELEKNPDILVSLNSLIQNKNIKGSVLVGFAAETEKLEEHALGKLERKGLKYIIGNYVGTNSGFGEVESSVRIFGKSGLLKEIQTQSKELIAKEISLFLRDNA